MKKVLGLDLGTTSIGWAVVLQAESDDERSSILGAGSRVNPLSSDEKDNFERGKDISTNADRRLKRSARRNLFRYKLRRDNLIALMKELGWIDDNSILFEQGNDSTFHTYLLRAKAVSEEINLQELARVLLMINKKRGYKSSRKVSPAKKDGKLIDGIKVAEELNEKSQTPAQYALTLLKDNKPLPDFYTSDLRAELDKIWEYQQAFYPEILTPSLKDEIKDKNWKTIAGIFERFDIQTADNKGKERNRTALEWRVEALNNELSKDKLSYVICDLSQQIQDSAGYLETISDRSKQLYFNKMTVGQYLWKELSKDRHFRVKNKVFYRQDYIEEFNQIWDTQAKFHTELTEELRNKIRDQIIFYQRRLKSQKSLVSFCEFESHKKVDKTGKEITIKYRVAPKSSLLFQEFRIWQRLNDIIISIEGDKNPLNQEQKQKLFVELTLREKLSDKEVLKLLKLSDDAELNFRKIDGNRTIHLLYKKFIEIAALTGNDVNEKKAASEIVKELEDIFESQGFNCNILHFDYDLEKKEYEKQPIFRLWHLLYSYEDDNSKTGNESLISKIADICSMPLEYAKVLAEIKFEDDYASLSHKAIKKLLPFLKQGDAYSDACEKAGYKHSKTSLTKEELETRALVEKLELLPKNSLRNPVVEKILNQMINLVNAVSEEYGKPDEIHIELSRKLKQSKEERKEATDYIAKNERRNEDIRKILLSDKFNLSSVSRNDIIKYKLYEELTLNGGHKTLYSDKHISPQELFSKEIDIEHIIPQSVLFDDSFANKTLEFSDVNRKKGKRTAFDFVASEYGPKGLQRYKARVEELLKQKKISEAKRNRLLMKESEIPSDFLERDLKETQYITKKAKEILEGYASRVMTTTGSVTAKLREDWGLINVLKELNMDKYEKLGLVEYKERLDSSSQKEIKYWTKRNDHRHHAVDAITVAFTRPSHIQLLNNLAAKSDKSSSIYRIRHKETHRNGNGKLVFNSPIPYNELRDKVKELLQGILVSHKAKNKVVTKNVNRTKCSGGFKTATNYTPRDYLHEDSIYGLIKRYETSLVPVNGKLTEEIINTVSNPKERNALLRRLREYGSDPKKAFTGKNALSKNPLNIEPDGSRLVLDKVKCTYLKKVYTLRKGVDKTLSVKDVVDDKVRRILEERIKAKGGTQEKAFENLEADPIWMNEAKRIPIRRVKIKVNFKESSVAALHSARDIMGQVLKDKKGMDIPADFVKFGNNHHVAIYKDAEGNYQEKVVTFFEAVHRANMGQDIVDKSYKSSEGWSFVFSMKSNEMFVFPNKESGFDPNEIDLKDPANYAAISPNLFRVQKLSSKYYNFRHHLETVQDYKPQISKKLNFDENQYQGTQDDLKKERDKVLKNETDLYTNKLQNITWKRITSIDKLKGVVKVRINHLGKIVAVGEE